MNCCSDYGKCEQGPGCPAREKALREFYKPDYCQKVQMFDRPPLYIRAWDSLFNLPHRITRWWDDLNELGRISSVVGLIAVCAVVGVVAVG